MNRKVIHSQEVITAQLTDAQKQLWILCQRDDNAARAYSVPVVLRLRGPLDIKILQQTIQDIVNRHEALRTKISADGQQQIISQADDLNIPVVNFSGLSDTEQESRLTHFLEAESSTLFDLKRGPLFRAALVKLDEKHHILTLVAHHIIIDGWSMGVLVNDIASTYTTRSQGQEPIKKPPLQFRQYAELLKTYLNDLRMQEDESYWLDQFRDSIPQLELPTDNPRPPAMTFTGSRYSLSMNSGLVNKLNALSQEQNCTPFMTLLAGFMILLHRLSAQDELIVGVPVTKRAMRGGGEIVGYCVNMIPVLGHIAADITFLEYLAQLRATLLDAYAHATYPFASLVKKLNLKRDPSRPLLVTTVFNMNAPLTTAVSIPDINLELVQPPISYTQHELSLNLIGINDELLMEIEYNTSLINSNRAQQLAQQLITLYEGIVNNPRQQVSSLNILSDKERRTLLVNWNSTHVDYPTNQCLHQLFEVQVEKTPEATAVIFEDQSLTYAELNTRANQLANHLRRFGVGSDIPVGICMERSLEMVIALYGILKAGGAYVPLDPDYPSDRLAYILDETQVPVVLVQNRLLDSLPTTNAHVLALDTEWESIAKEPTHTPENLTKPQDLAYVIYTSGSTGKPKGVAIPHTGIVNRLLWMQDAYGLNETDRILQKTPFSFDVSVWEFFWPLITGARLVVAKPQGHKDTAYLARLIAQAQITTLHFVPPVLAVFLEEPGIGSCVSLRRVFCSGEALPYEVMQRHFSRLNVPLYNLYGPTEASVDVTHWTCTRDTHLSIVPIGRPIANTQIYILDSHLNPVPIGVPGELHIGGAGLARGYLNRPDLTKEKFIVDPFSNEPGARLYKTGDLSRYLPDGNIEFLGRIDHQVKIHGFRIELGEIEATLAEHPAIRETVVIVRDDGPAGKHLVGYIVTNQDMELDTNLLKNFLTNKLPDYMVPATFVFLDELPLSPNGKVDRKALPAPEQKPELKRDYVAPQTQNEKILAEIWCGLLNVEKISINDNFFELGGDSILGIQVISRATQAELTLTAAQLFEHQTVAQLAAVAKTAKLTLAEQDLVIGPVLLTPVQQWYFAADLPAPDHFNQSILFEVRKHLNSKLLKSAIQHLMEHHDALRMRFHRVENTWLQTNAGLEEHSIFSHVDVSSYPTPEQATAIETTAAQLQTSLDIQSGPLLRIALITPGSDQPDRLLLIIHHLVVDGVSWRILLEDLQTVYQQLQSGKPVILPQKTTSFKEWAERLQNYAQSDHVREELKYWQTNTLKPVARIPVDTPGGANTMGTSRSITVSLTVEETQALLQKAPEAYHTQVNDLLLTALTQTLSTWAGTQEIQVDLEGHGREPVFDDLDISRTVGWFTTIFPVRLNLSGSTETGSVIKAIKEQLRAVPQKGMNYGVLRYLTNDPRLRAELCSLTQSEILFNYLGQFDQVLPEGSLLCLAQEGHGPDHNETESRRYLFDINSSVIEGQLAISWTYSTELHQHETVENLAKGFADAVRSLVTHCLSSEAGGYTPSDFSDIDLDQSDLDNLLKEYEDENDED